MIRHVLVVDDEPNIRLALDYLLTRAGHRVTSVADGRSAIRAARDDRPDAVVLDLMLPDMDGYEVCQSLREDPDLRDVPILMLTARGREVDREKGLSLGADDYLVKPFPTHEVVHRVERLLGGR